MTYCQRLVSLIRLCENFLRLRNRYECIMVLFFSFTTYVSRMSKNPAVQICFFVASVNLRHLHVSWCIRLCVCMKALLFTRNTETDHGIIIPSEVCVSACTYSWIETARGIQANIAEGIIVSCWSCIPVLSFGFISRGPWWARLPFDEPPAPQG